jgi:hypothetical protein
VTELALGAETSNEAVVPEADPLVMVTLNDCAWLAASEATSMRDATMNDFCVVMFSFCGRVNLVDALCLPDSDLSVKSGMEKCIRICKTVRHNLGLIGENVSS